MNGDGPNAEALKEKELGNAAYKLRKFTEALGHYEKAISLDPKEMSYLSNKAAVFFEQKEYQKCIDQCQKAFEVGRENLADFKLIARALARMASAYAKLEDFEQAKLYYEKSLTEHRTPDTLTKLSEVEKLLKDRARMAYIDPEISLQEKQKGNDFFLKGDYPTAMKHYSEAIRRNPDDAKLYSNRAACYQKLAEPHLALKDCDECIRLEPSFVKGYIRKGFALLAMRDTSKAKTSFEKALELDPNSSEAIDGFRKCSMGYSNLDPEEAKKRALSDPEVQQILKDPAMRIILEQMNSDPEAFKDHVQNPEIAAKIQKLFESGLISFQHR